MSVLTSPALAGTARLPNRGRLILVGGVPGAGKSTAIASVAATTPSDDVLDPDGLRRRLRSRLPAATPYRCYRPVVHGAYAVAVLVAVLRGPVVGHTLVVHGPATRPWRRQLFARLARARGWDPVLLFVDASRATAEAGQRRRGRVVKRSSFEGHWRRWRRLRERLVLAAPALDSSQWSQVWVVDRVDAADALRHLIPLRATPSTK